MTSISKRSQINLYDNVEGEFKFSLAQGQQSCAMDVPTQWHVSTEAFKLTSGAQVVANVAASILANTASVATEQLRAEAAESALQVAVEDEASARTSADAGLQTNINTEKGRITQEISDRIADVAAEETERKAAVSAESTRAQDAEGEIRVMVYTEQGDRAAADSVLSTSISEEKSRAEAAELALDGRVTNEKDRIDAILALSAQELNTFKEIADAYTSADSSLQTLITTLTSRFDALEQVVNTLAPQE